MHLFYWIPECSTHSFRSFWSSTGCSIQGSILIRRLQPYTVAVTATSLVFRQLFFPVVLQGSKRGSTLQRETLVHHYKVVGLTLLCVSCFVFPPGPQELQTIFFFLSSPSLWEGEQGQQSEPHNSAYRGVFEPPPHTTCHQLFFSTAISSRAVGGQSGLAQHLCALEVPSLGKRPAADHSVH